MSWWCEKGHNYFGRRSSLASDLVEYGITVPELFVMDQVACSSFFDGILWRRAQLIKVAFEEHEPWPGLRREDCLNAINGLAEKGLLHEITEEEVEKWQARRLEETIPSCEDKGLNYSARNIDFTPKGYELYGRIEREVFGCVRLGVRLDPDEKQVVILGEDEAAVRKEAASYTEFIPFDSILGTEDRPVKARLKRIIGPTRIGPWRLSRFEVVPSGFMTVLEYE